MAINYKFELDKEVLKVKASGIDDDLEDVYNYSRDVLGIAIKNQCKKIFCDERDLQYTLSTIDTFHLAETASKEARALTKIAIVCNPKFLEDGRFYETVAKNRGLRVFVTSNYQQALEWLD